MFYFALRHVGGEGSGNPLQYSCLENPMDRGAWWAAVHGVPKSRTRLSDSISVFLVSQIYTIYLSSSVKIRTDSSCYFEFEEFRGLNENLIFYLEEVSCLMLLLLLFSHSVMFDSLIPHGL